MVGAAPDRREAPRTASGVGRRRARGVAGGRTVAVACAAMPAADTPAAVAFPGPAVLGRGAVVSAGQPAPRALAGARRVVVDGDVLADPAAAAAVLHHHWVTRTPVVIELAVDNEALRAPETCDLPPYQLTPDHRFERERLHFLMWANTYDCRGAGEDATPTWWHGVLAQRRGAGASEVADVQLADGTDVWVDGGPRGPLEVPTVHRESVALGRLPRTPTPGPGDARPGDDLAGDQLAAVEHRAGPARIIAPAGSGKTRVLTARLRHLLRDRGYEPELVTAVAYNTRAAAEMRERTATDPTLPTANIRTLHSLGMWICNLEGRRDIVTERDVRAILDRLVSTARIPNQDPFQPYLEALSEVRLALRDPAEVEAARDDVDGFAELFDRYRERARPARRARLRRADLPRARAAPDPPGPAPRGATPLHPPARRRVPGPHAGVHAARAAVRRPVGAGVRGRRRRPGDLQLRRRDPRLPHRVRPLLPRRPPPRARGQLPLPAVGRGVGRDAARAQPPAGRQGHPPGAGAHRRRRAGGPRGRRRGDVAAVGVADRGLARRRAASLGHRGAGPGQRRAPAGAGGARQRRRAAHGSARRERAGPDRDPHRARRTCGSGSTPSGSGARTCWTRSTAPRAR